MVLRASKSVCACTASLRAYLAPIFIGLIGGIIAYFAIRRDDPQKAKRCLMVGIGLTAVNVILNLAILSTGSFEQEFNVNV